MVQEISRDFLIQSVPLPELSSETKFFIPKNQEVLFSMKAGNENGWGSKIGNIATKAWRGVYQIFQTLLGWIFCQCFCAEKKSEKDGSMLLPLIKKNIPIEEKVEVFHQFPEEIKDRLFEIFPKKTAKEIIEKCFFIIEKVFQLEYFHKMLKEIKSLIPQVGSEEKNRALLDQLSALALEAIHSNQFEFSSEKFNKHLESVVQQIEDGIEKLEKELDNCKKNPLKYGIT